MVFRDVDLSSAEQNGKHCEGRSENECRIVRGGSRGRIVRDYFETGNDGFELQCNVRDRSNRRDNGDEHGQAACFAVAGSDKIGDRSEILALADRDDAMNHAPAKQDDHHRAQVDGQIAPTVFGGAAHGTVECPGRAVDRQRQAIDRRARRAREALRISVVAPIGDSEEDRNVAQRQQEQRPPTDQRFFPSLSATFAGRSLLIRGVYYYRRMQAISLSHPSI